MGDIAAESIKETSLVSVEQKHEQHYEGYDGWYVDRDRTLH